MRVFLLFVILCVGIGFAYHYTKPAEKPLKIYNPTDIQPELVDRDLLGKGFGHVIGQFSFTDQSNTAFGSKQIKGKVLVAEYFFTTCGTICPRMNEQMKRVQLAFKNNLNLQIASFTVDPEIDTVAQLARYAEDHDANNKQWHFLTGKNEDLYRFARRSLFILKPAEVANQGDVGSDFIHTNNFVLVDQKGQLRGYYDGTSELEVDQLIHDIDHLLNE